MLVALSMPALMHRRTILGDRPRYASIPLDLEREEALVANAMARRCTGRCAPHGDVAKV